MFITLLSCRSSGDTLTRENFYKTKARLAEKRMLTRKSPSGAIGIGDRFRGSDALAQW